MRGLYKVKQSLYLKAFVIFFLISAFWDYFTVSEFKAIYKYYLGLIVLPF